MQMRTFIWCVCAVYRTLCTGTHPCTRRCHAMQSGWLGEQICTNAFWIFGAHNNRYNGIYQVVDSHWCNGKPIYQAYDDTEGAGNKFGPVLYQPTGALASMVSELPMI